MLEPFEPKHLTVLIIPVVTLERLTLFARHYAVQARPNPLDNRGDNLNYPVRDKEMVNFIRHCLINRTRADTTPSGHQWGYDNLLHRIAVSGIDVEARQLALRLAILRLTAQHYPFLAHECDYQRWNLLGKSPT